MRAFVDPDNLPVGEMVDCYRVVRRLGGGGQGTAYLVEKDGELFTLKMARHREQSYQDSHHTDGRIQRELACLLVMRHRHIARVWAHGRWPHSREGYFYLVMDYVEGCTLGEWLERHRVTAHEVVVVMEKVMGAVAYMHELGIHHRDLKPGNILVDGQGEPVVVDYGAAHFPVAPELTDQRLPPGTPRYTSPEARLFDAKHRNDRAARYEFKVADELFALGVTLYDLLTDARPWSHPKNLPVGSPYYSASFAREENERVPVALSEFVDGLIAQKPEERPVSVEAARRDLAEFIPLTAEEWMKRPLHPPRLEEEAEPAPLPSSEDAPRLPLLPLPSQADLALVPAANLPAVPPPAPQAPPLRRRWARAAAAAGGLCALLACGVYLALHGGTPVPPSPGALETPPPLRPPSPSSAAGSVDTMAAPAPVSPQPLSIQEEAAPVTSANPSKKPSPSQCSQTTPPPRATPLWRAWCKCAGVVGTLVALQAGCTGAQVRPSASSPCSEEAIKAMKELGLRFGTDRPWVVHDISKKVDETEGYILFEGPLTGVVRKPQGKLVAGTLFFGEMRLGRADSDNRPIAVIRYTQAQLPDGTKWPICSETAQNVEGPVPPGGAGFPEGNPVGVTDEWTMPWGNL